MENTLHTTFYRVVFFLVSIFSRQSSKRGPMLKFFSKFFTAPADQAVPQKVVPWWHNTSYVALYHSELNAVVAAMRDFGVHLNVRMSITNDAEFFIRDSIFHEVVVAKVNVTGEVGLPAAVVATVKKDLIFFDQIKTLLDAEIFANKRVEGFTVSPKFRLVVE